MASPSEAAFTDAPTVRTKALLVAVTDEARAALGGKSQIRIDHVPFKVGRESRRNSFARVKDHFERRFRQALPLNDLYLLEPEGASFLQISREHFLIAVVDGRFVVVDRESACGTIVGGMPIGGGRLVLEIVLNDGDEIVVGGDDSPFIFRFSEIND